MPDKSGMPQAPPRCRRCGGATAIGRNRKGVRVAVCAECGATQGVEHTRAAPAAVNQWWTRE